MSQHRPIAHAHACHTPILLAHGRLDALVPFRQAELLAAALGRAGRPARTAVFADEGHGITGTRGRVRLARAVAAFLGAHLHR